MQLSLLWLALLVAIAIFAPYLPLPYAPTVPDLAHIATLPGNGHWLGTDGQGQDVLANLLFGTRTVVLITLPAALLAAAVGALAGSAAGFWGNNLRVPLPCALLLAGTAWWALRLPHYPAVIFGMAAAGSWLLLSWVHPLRKSLPMLGVPLDTFVLGTTALLGAVPRLLLVVAVASFGVNQAALLALLTLLAWPDAARLVRAQMRRVQILPFVEAAQALGLRPVTVWLRHALPHAIQPLRTELPLSIVGLIGLETTLSFLGIGLPPTVPSWGRMLASARLNSLSYISAVYPFLMIVFTILSMQILAKNKK
jgi:peptide/nickel transport system permease protein